MAPLTSLMRWDSPSVKVILKRDPASPYTFVPLIRPLSKVGGPEVSAAVYT